MSYGVMGRRVMEGGMVKGIMGVLGRGVVRVRVKVRVRVRVRV